MDEAESIKKDRQKIEEDLKAAECNIGQWPQESLKPSYMFKIYFYFKESILLGVHDQHVHFEVVISKKVDELLAPFNHRVRQSLRQQEELLHKVKVSTRFYHSTWISMLNKIQHS